MEPIDATMAEEPQPQNETKEPKDSKIKPNLDTRGYRNDPNQPQIEKSRHSGFLKTNKERFAAIENVQNKIPLGKETLIEYAEQFKVTMNYKPFGFFQLQDPTDHVVTALQAHSAGKFNAMTAIPFGTVEE